jgi:hypothetical protein
VSALYNLNHINGLQPNKQLTPLLAFIPRHRFHIALPYFIHCHLFNPLLSLSYASTLSSYITFNTIKPSAKASIKETKLEMTQLHDVTEAGLGSHQAVPKQMGSSVPVAGGVSSRPVKCFSCGLNHHLGDCLTAMPSQKKDIGVRLFKKASSSSDQTTPANSIVRRTIMAEHTMNVAIFPDRSIMPYVLDYRAEAVVFCHARLRIPYCLHV